MSVLKTIQIVGISGSLRKTSFSTGILTILRERVKPSMDLKVVTLEKIPFHNEDLDTEPGVPAVSDLKRMITESDGVLIATPEYNHGVPGVLKNALDWLSRPVYESCFKNKPVSLISSSKAFTGGVRSQYQLREALISMHAHLVMGPEVVVGGVHHNFTDDGYADEQGLTFMVQSLERLKNEILARRSLMV